MFTYPGRGGEGIRQLQSSSGARVDINRTRSDDRAQPRRITITGSADQIMVAKVSIMITGVKNSLLIHQ